MPRHNISTEEHISKSRVIEILESNKWKLGWKYTKTEEETAKIINGIINGIIDEIK